MFTGCAICAAIGFVAEDASAQAPSGIRRKVTSRIDGPNEGYETLQVLVDIEPNFVIAWHTHPGTEAAYTLEGDGELQIKGEAAKMLKPGFSWLIRFPLDQSGKRISQPARRLSEADIPIPKGSTGCRMTPPDSPHTLKNGAQATTLFVTFTVQKESLSLRRFRHRRKNNSCGKNDFE